MADLDFTEDVVGNGDFVDSASTSKEGVASEGATPASASSTSVAENSEKIPKGTDDNSAEDRKLFVGGLSWETREPQLKEYFEKFGSVESINLKVNPVTGRSRCFAFVVFDSSQSVEKVLSSDNEHAINSKKVDVKKAKAKPGKIFVGGLKPEMTDEEIRNCFEQFGSVVEFEMPYDKSKNQRKGFGFVTFEREETMKDLIKKGKVTIGEHEVDLRKATPKTDFNRMGGGGNFGFNQDPYNYDYYGGYGDYYAGGWGMQYGQQMNSYAGGKMTRNKTNNPSAADGAKPY